MNYKLLILSTLLFLVIEMGAIAQCKSLDIVITVESVKPGEGGGIVIDLNRTDVKKLSINVFGPFAKNQLESQKTEFRNLEKGKYTVVIAGKREEDNLCPFSKEVTIN